MATITTNQATKTFLISQTIQFIQYLQTLVQTTQYENAILVQAI